MASTDDANSAAQAIGFTFNFNGTAFTDFVMSTNGLIRLGTAAPSSAALYYTYAQSTTDVGGAAAGAVSSVNAADVNLLMPFNVDLIQGTGTADYRMSRDSRQPHLHHPVEERSRQSKSHFIGNRRVDTYPVHQHGFPDSPLRGF